MSRVAVQNQQRDPEHRGPQRLPVRWAVIGLATVAAGAVGFAVGSWVPAIVVACAVATAAHRLID
ncbi:hypothetical protein ACIO14_05580 [Nocardia fluminea]|uniref:hypothetical protein n=1 Tax=Nocardia fluminea TaxID=134984 RepID=UPI0038207EB7